MPDTELALNTPIEIDPPAAPQRAAATPAAPEDRVYRCRHIFADGHRCGSPALRTQNFCYYHYTRRDHALHGRDDRRRREGFELDCVDGLDNATSIQLSIAEIARRLARNTIEPRRAGLMLYAMQLAAHNLGRLHTGEAATPADEIVDDATFGHLAELEPGRAQPETLLSRFEQAAPFRAFDPPYEITPQQQHDLDVLEGRAPMPANAPQKSGPNPCGN